MPTTTLPEVVQHFDERLDELWKDYKRLDALRMAVMEEVVDAFPDAPEDLILLFTAWSHEHIRDRATSLRSAARAAKANEARGADEKGKGGGQPKSRKDAAEQTALFAIKLPDANGKPKAIGDFAPIDTQTHVTRMGERVNVDTEAVKTAQDKLRVAKAELRIWQRLADNQVKQNAATLKDVRGAEQQLAKLHLT